MNKDIRILFKCEECQQAHSLILHLEKIDESKLFLPKGIVKKIPTIKDKIIIGKNDDKDILPESK